MSETAPVRRRLKTHSRKAQLTQIAAKIFADEGYMETSVECILKQAGLTAPAFYRHFASKREILDNICINSIEISVNVASDIQSNPRLSPARKLRKLIRARLDYLFGPDGSSSLLVVSEQAHLSDAAREKVMALQHDFRAIIASVLKEIKPKASDDEIRASIFLVRNLIVHSVWWHKEPLGFSKKTLRILVEQSIWSTLVETSATA